MAPLSTVLFSLASLIAFTSARVVEINLGTPSQPDILYSTTSSQLDSLTFGIRKLADTSPPRFRPIDPASATLMCDDIISEHFFNTTNTPVPYFTIDQRGSTKDNLRITSKQFLSPPRGTGWRTAPMRDVEIRTTAELVRSWYQTYPGTPESAWEMQYVNATTQELDSFVGVFLVERDLVNGYGGRNERPNPRAPGQEEVSTA